MARADGPAVTIFSEARASRLGPGGTLLSLAVALVAALLTTLPHVPAAAATSTYAVDAAWPGAEVRLGSQQTVRGTARRSGSAVGSWSVLLERAVRTDSGAMSWEELASVSAPLWEAATDYEFAVPTDRGGDQRLRVSVWGPTDSGRGMLAQDQHTMRVVQPSRTVTARWMAPARVRTGARRTVEGTVASTVGTPQAGVVVEVQQLEHNGTWRTAARTNTDALGAYSVRVPTHFYHSGRWRVLAPASGDYAAMASSTQGSQQVVPSYDPIGSARSFALWGPHWDSCRTIGYRLNVGGHYRFSRREVRRAFSQVGRATGLRMVYRGTTGHIPDGTAAGNPPRPADADIVLAWARPSQTRIELGDALGIARITVWGNTYTNGASRQSISESSIVLNKGLRRFRSNNRRIWSAAMLHEISHAVGLDHVQDRRQVMNPVTSATRPLTRLSAGDLRGLNQVGVQAGCFSGDPSAGGVRSGRVTASGGRAGAGAPGGLVLTRH